MSGLRIIMVGHCHPDMPHVCAMRVRCFAGAMAGRGHRVVLLSESLAGDGPAAARPSSRRVNASGWGSNATASTAKARGRRSPSTPPRAPTSQAVTGTSAMTRAKGLRSNRFVATIMPPNVALGRRDGRIGRRRYITATAVHNRY